MRDQRWSWRSARLICPLISPLRSDGDIDEDATARLVDHVLQGGVNGLFILGTSGEGPWLTATEQRRLARSVVAAVGGRGPVLAGILEASTARAIETGRMLRDTGVDALAVTTPYYYEPGAEAVNEHVFAISEAFADMPLVLYNIPQMTHRQLRLDHHAALAGIRNVIGIKDSSGDDGALLSAIAVKRHRPDFLVWQGAEARAVDGLQAGADGLVPGLSNLLPSTFRALLDAFDAGDAAAVQERQRDIAAAWEIHGFGFWLECLKYAAHTMGFGSGRTLAPRSSLGHDDQQRIVAQLGLEVGSPTP